MDNNFWNESPLETSSFELIVCGCVHAHSGQLKNKFKHIDCDLAHKQYMG